MLHEQILRYGQTLRATAHHASGKVSARYDTSDIVQESMLQIWLEMEKARPDEFEANKSYLSKVGRGVANNMRRYHTARKRTALTEASSVMVDSAHSREQNPEELVVRQESILHLIRAISQLSQDEQMLVYRKFFDQKSVAQIAAEFKLSVDVVRGKLERAKSQIKRSLENIAEMD